MFISSPCNAPFYIVKSTTEERGRLTNSVSSWPKSNLKLAQLSVVRQGRLQIEKTGESTVPSKSS